MKQVEVYPWEELWIGWLSAAKPTADSVSSRLVPTHFTDSIMSRWMTIRLQESVLGAEAARFDWLRGWLKTAGSLKEEKEAPEEAKRRQASCLPAAASASVAAEAEAAARAAVTERLRVEMEAATHAIDQAAQAAQQLEAAEHVAKQDAQRKQAELEAELERKPKSPKSFRLLSIPWKQR